MTASGTFGDFFLRLYHLGLGRIPCGIKEFVKYLQLLELDLCFLAPFQAFMAYPSSLNSLALGYSPWDDTSRLIHSPSADIGSKGVARTSNSSFDDGIGSLSRTISSSELSKQGKPGSLFHGNLLNCIDDWFKLVNHGEVLDLQLYTKVYQILLKSSFIGSVFDRDTQLHAQKLKEMDPINFETALLLMRNLTINLSSPDFEPIASMLRNPLVQGYRNAATAVESESIAR
ncbi:hypothetical protein CsSME_00038496 [Camellia sinensis var. sinensis]